MKQHSDSSEYTPPSTPSRDSSQSPQPTSERDGNPSTVTHVAVQRSPSPFEPTEVYDSNPVSVTAASTTQDDLYDATPIREIRALYLDIQRAGSISHEADPDTDERSIITGLQNVALDTHSPSDDAQVDGVSVTDGLHALDLGRDTTSSTSNTGHHYSIRDESLPAEPYFDQAFQQALKCGTQLAGRVASCLRTRPTVNESDSSLQTLQLEAQKLSEYKAPDKRIIGIVGKSGSGKSSLVNSLLDVDELAMTGSSGTAVTAFVTEYQYQPDRMAPRFTINAVCLTPDEIKDNLGELLQDFRNPELIDRGDITMDELDVLKLRSEAAKSIFMTAFGNCEGFSLERIKYQDGGREAALTLLESWACHLQWPDGTHDGKWEAAAADEEEYHAKTEPFLTRGLWPFVKRVVVHLRSPVLRNGIILADLPGYHDVNAARVAAAKRYQSTCDEVFVVTEIKRCEVDPVIKEVVDERKGHSAVVGVVTCPNVTVVCTNAWDLGNKKDKKSLESRIPRERLRHAQAQITKVNRGHGSFQDARRAYKEAELNLDGLLMQVRNQDARDCLRRAYAEFFPQNSMPVFCVDNVLYQEQHSSQAVILSGIPDLRRYCLSLPGRALFRSANNFLQTILPSLITSVDIWYDAAHAKGTQLLSDIADTKGLHDRLDSLVEEWKGILAQNCRVSLFLPWRNNTSTITDATLSTCLSWNRMPDASYRAWVRHNGTHRTGAVGYKCWNTELVASMNDVSAPHWISLDDEVGGSLERVAAQMQSCLVEYRSLVEGSNAPESLIRNLRHRERLVTTIFDDSIEDALRRFRLIKHRATTGSSVSYLLAYMIPGYEAAAMDSGPGVTDRMRSAMRAHISHPSFVARQSQQIRHDLGSMGEQIATALSDRVHLVLAATDADLQTVQAPDASLLAKYPDFGRSVKSLLDEARTELELIEEKAGAAREDARDRGYI